MRYVLWIAAGQLFIHISISARLISLPCRPQFRRQEPKTWPSNYEGNLQKRGLRRSSKQLNTIEVGSNDQDDTKDSQASRSTLSATRQRQSSRSLSGSIETTYSHFPIRKLWKPVATRPIRQPIKADNTRQANRSASADTAGASQQSGRPSMQHASSPARLARSETQPRLALRRVKSAPSLIDVSSMEKYLTVYRAADAADKQAKIMNKVTIDFRKRNRDTFARLNLPYPSALLPRQRASEYIDRYDQVTASTRAYAGQLNRQAKSYNKAAQISQVAGRSAKVARNRKKEEASNIGAHMWKSWSKCHSYLSQTARCLIRQGEERQRILSNPDPQALGAVGGDVHSLLSFHDRETANMVHELTQKVDHSRHLGNDLRGTFKQLVEEGGYESDAPRPHPQVLPLDRLPPEDQPIRPSTPSPASSSGLPDTDERLRRISSSSSGSG